MCATVYIDGRVCQTVADLRLALGIEPVVDPAYAASLTEHPERWHTCCTCGVDVEATLDAAGREWTKSECGDYDAKGKP